MIFSKGSGIAKRDKKREDRRDKPGSSGEMADMMQGGGIAGAVDDRTAALEKKVKELEALVKGLTEEFLDMKSVVMRLNRFSESRTEMRGAAKQAVPGATGQAAGAAGTVTLQRKGARTTESVQVQTAAPKEPEKMDMIMQNDGTLKPEKRKETNEYIVASANYNKQRAKPSGSDDPKRKNTLIVAEEDEKAGSKK